MKFSKSLLIISIAAIAFCCLFMTSCNDEPIFYNICQEVELEDAVVKGNVYSIVETENYLYAANGYIYRKGLTEERGWKEVELPSDASSDNKVIRLASTDGYLYCFTNTGKVYYTETATSTVSWNDISDDLVTVSSSANNTCTIFDNDAPCNGNGKRRAFYSDSSNNKVYELIDGVPQTSVASGITSVAVAGYSRHYTSSSSSKPTCPIAAAYISNGDITVVAPDELITSDRESMFYHVADDVVKYSSDGTSWSTVEPSLSTPFSASYYTDGSSKWIYVGTKDSIECVNLNQNTGVPTTTISSPIGSNVTSCLGGMEIIGIYPYPLGSGNLYAAAVVYLSTTAASNNNKLWGYYPTRENDENNTWNCE
ncbi:MAG: hypothetical protein K5839_04680 [Treponemataceae bacterium]|nr:hypothetical protein [Treponemataceae bacterium]